MNVRNRAIGKVFISYSHADKRFARRIARQLEQNGYEVWLDEKELVAGDPLSQSISEAITTAEVVLAIVSADAARSKWLKYELNHATGRMVQGQCRVIPVVIDDHKLPAEVAGLLYADFRSSFKHGMNSVLTALSHEVARRPKYFYQLMDDAVSDIIGSIGHASTMTEYSPASDSYQFASVLVPENGGHFRIEAVYDTEDSYGLKNTPLDNKFWSEYTEINSQRRETFFVLVSKRPIGFELDYVHEDEPKIGVKSFPSYDDEIENCWAIVVDMSDTPDSDGQRRLLRMAKDCLVDVAQKLRHSTE